MKIIDSHCHLHDERYKDDLPMVLNRAQEAGVTHFVTIGCDIPTTEAAQKIAHAYVPIYFSAGFHPHDAKDMDEGNFLALKEMAKDEKCVAIGECGLDYYYEHSPKDVQQRVFKKQLELAYELKKPVVIHLRDAYEDCFAILKEANLQEKIVIHCFSGTKEHAQQFLDLGCYISLSGIVTFKKPLDLLEVAKMTPKNRLLIETDAPYLTPHPHRGMRNEPHLIVLTLKTVALARQEDENELACQLYKNTMEFFSLSQRRGCS